jgi:hypothetical protein
MKVCREEKEMPRAEIQQAHLSQFSLLAEFFIRKVLVKDGDSKVLILMNLNPDDSKK